MPANTPIYGFTYPCPGELVTGTTFATLASQIDTKMLDVNNDMVLALNRPNRDLTSSGATQNIPAGVDTVLTLVGSQYVIPMAGVWIFQVTVLPASSPTVNMMRASVRQNGVVRFRFNANTENNNAAPVQPAGPIVAAVGDAITTQFLYNGAGTMDVTAEFTAKMIVRIP